MTIVGIDLGTTTSLVAAVRDGGPQVLAALPSAVAWLGDGTARTGDEALLGEAVLGVKRHLADPAEPGLPGPVEAAAEILRALRERAQAALGEPVGQAVLAVPAHFHPGQRQALREAARQAGLEVVRMPSDPVAAALAYAHEAPLQGTFAVFDLGGGTFDLSLLRVDGDMIDVLATLGDDRLGGDDLDRALVAALAHDAGAVVDLAPALVRARAAREALSLRLDADVDLPLAGGGRLRRRVTRGQLDHIVAPALQRCLAMCRRALAHARLRPAEIEAVVMSGGATRSPTVQRFVGALFEQRPRAAIDPTRVVALGAAAHGAMLAQGGPLLVNDALSRAIGLEVGEGVVVPLLPRGSTLPASAHVAVPAGVALHLVHGEDEFPRRFATFEASGEVRVLLDADGVARVTVGGEAVALRWPHAAEAGRDTVLMAPIPRDDA